MLGLILSLVVVIEQLTRDLDNMNEELEDELRRLFEYVDIGEHAEGEWPAVPVYWAGQIVHGAIMDDFYDILIRIYEIYQEERND